MQRVHSILDTAPVYAHGIRGQGVGIAIIDTGIAPHPDFLFPYNRIVGFYDVTQSVSDTQKNIVPYDSSGHGTHVAGIAAGTKGIAPESHLIGVRILGNQGTGHTEDMIPALQWILEHRETYGIRIVNISIGCTSPDCKRNGENSPLSLAVESLWDAGLIVVAAAGNEGPAPMSITVPGVNRKIITVGALEDDLQGRSPSRGPTAACIRKPDIVAPGNQIVSCRAPRGYTTKSGTSMSTPMVSGAIALLLSRYPDLNNLEVKIRLKNSAVDLGLPHARQGWGLLNVKNLVLRS